MKPRIFISVVTSELGATRQLVANVLLRLGYDPVTQDIFGTESGDLRPRRLRTLGASREQITCRAPRHLTITALIRGGA